jgi:membrane protein insertase Oxa1/YidC/SpoIIIJ
MFTTLWYNFLYQPVFNLLIWLYNDFSADNFAWSIVLLTILIRIVLLPFTLVTEKAQVENLELESAIRNAEKEFSNDAVLRNQEIRRILKKRKIRPWAKTIVLGVQLLVLVLLYQVFLQGITGTTIIHILYPIVDFPGKINIIFYGFDLSERYTLFWPGIVAVFLFLEIYMELRGKRVRQADMFYLLLFPAASFAILWWLPLVKSIFIFTSIIFSIVVHQISRMFMRPPKIDH